MIIACHNFKLDYPISMVAVCFECVNETADILFKKGSTFIEPFANVSYAGEYCVQATWH